MRFCSIATQSVTPRGRPTNSPIVRRLYPSSAMAHLQEGAGLEVFRAPPEVDDALGRQRGPAVHHAGGESLLAGVVVAPQVGEASTDRAAGVAAEQVRELHRGLGVRMTLVQQGPRVAEGGGHREELHDDVDAAK